MKYYINLKDVKSFVELNDGKVLSKKKSTRVIDGEYVDGWTFYLDRTNLPKVKNACKDYVNIKCFQAWGVITYHSINCSGLIGVIQFI